MFMFNRSNSGRVHVESIDVFPSDQTHQKNKPTPTLTADIPPPSPKQSPSSTPPQSPSVCQEIKPLSEAEANVYTCPINMEIFVDPVITKEGYTFERHAIVKWLATNNTCPLSRGPLTINELIPNKNLKHQIEYYRKIGKLPKLVDPLPETTPPTTPSPTTPPPLQRRSRAIWTSTGNNSYSDAVNRHEMTISFSNSGGFSEQLGIENPRSSIDIARRAISTDDGDTNHHTNNYLQTIIDILTHSSSTSARQTQVVPINQDSIPTVRHERPVIQAIYNSELLEPADIPENPDFSFLAECDKNMIQSAYNTVSRLNKWDYMRRYNPSIQTGYMFDRDPTMYEIKSAIDCDYDGHSGSSLGYTMRRIQYIAKNGFEKFKQNYLEN